MANKNFWLGILVMVLAFGMTVVGCDDGSTNRNSEGNGGIFTLTGIPLQYEGKYAQFQTKFDSNSTSIIVGLNYNQSAGTSSLCRISHGKKDFPVWIQTFGGTEASIKKYSGNNTVEGAVGIFDNASPGPGNPPISSIVFESIVFSNGNATKSWDEGETWD